MHFFFKLQSSTSTHRCVRGQEHLYYTTHQSPFIPRCFPMPPKRPWCLAQCSILKLSWDLDLDIPGVGWCSSSELSPAQYAVSVFRRTSVISSENSLGDFICCRIKIGTNIVRCSAYPVFLMSEILHPEVRCQDEKAYGTEASELNSLFLRYRNDGIPCTGIF